ncbi:MAG TPA: helix-turn-helix transcriptional regulator [Chthonomonadaceae bacterium]|nr:helix-turn-helix transcriptional regulator [Chthonomonadaceae bacterium]
MSEDIGAFIRALRVSKQMSLRSLAKSAGISPGTLSHWESGQVVPRIPELDAALTALGASPCLRQEAYARINAPRALARLRQEKAPATDTAESLAALPTAGDLLRALRHRRGFSLEQAAALLKLQPSTISRWERSQTLSSADTLEAYCTLLGACPAERQALAGLFLPHGGADAPSSLDALEQTLERLRREAMRGESALLDLRFLSLEAQLWHQAAQNRLAQPLLLKTYIWHAQWLLWQERIGEAGRLAQRALDLAPQEARPERGWFRAVHVYATYLVTGRKRPQPARGVQFVQDWLAEARWPDTEAWMRHNLATYLLRAGQIEAARRSAEQGHRAALRSENRTAIRNSSCDSAVILLQTGRPEAARALLPTGEQPNVYHRVYEVQTWTETLFALGDHSGAYAAFLRTREIVQTYGLASRYIAPFTDRF